MASSTCVTLLHIPVWWRQLLCKPVSEHQQRNFPEIAIRGLIRNEICKLCQLKRLNTTLPKPRQLQSTQIPQQNFGICSYLPASSTSFPSHISSSSPSDMWGRCLWLNVCSQIASVSCIAAKSNSPLNLHKAILGNQTLTEARDLTDYSESQRQDERTRPLSESERGEEKARKQSTTMCELTSHEKRIFSRLL